MVEEGGGGSGGAGVLDADAVVGGGGNGGLEVDFGGEVGSVGCGECAGVGYCCG